MFKKFVEQYLLFAIHRTTVEFALPTRLAFVQEDGPGFCFNTQGRVSGVADEKDEVMLNPNTDLTKEATNTVRLFGVFMAHVASILPTRIFRMPLEVSRVRVFLGDDIRPDAMPPRNAREQHIRAPG